MKDNSAEIEIGYVCGRGHFCFYSDPEEDGSCGSKRTASIIVRRDHPYGDMFYPPVEEEFHSSSGYSEEDYLNEIDEANNKLGIELNYWRRNA